MGHSHRDADAAALPDGEPFDARMFAHHRSIRGNDVAGSLNRIGLTLADKDIMFAGRDEANFLAVFLLSNIQPQRAGDFSDNRFVVTAHR